MPSFSKGEIIFQDTPYATAVLDERLEDTCNWCFAHEVQDPFICCGCAAVLYCSERCRNKDREYHSLECIFLNSEIADEGDSGMKRYALRTLIRVLAETKSESCENHQTVGMYFGQRCTFKDLVSHADRLDEDQTMYFRAMSEDLAEFASDHGHEVSQDLVFDIMLKLFINGHCAKDYSFLNSVQLGQVIYLAGSRTNHSCVFQNNYIQLFKGNRCILKALKDFTVSDPLELTTQYIPLQFSYPMRQELLKKRYFFTCECARCVEEATQPRPPFLAGIERFLLQSVSSETLGQLESLRPRFARFPNTNFYKNILLTRLFLEGKRENVEQSFSLGTAALEGCQLLTDRMKILYILCSDLARFGANKSNHEYYDRFKHFHEITLSLFTDLHGPGHPLVEHVTEMAVPDTAKESNSSSKIPKVEKSTPVILDAV